MKYELLKYLKLSTQAEWLWQYFINNNNSQEINSVKHSGEKLYQLTQTKLAEILSLAKSQHKLNIFIVETDSIKFLAAFLAGAIAEVNLFLGDPAWQKSEWQQVLSIVQPDLIFGEQKSQNLITQAEASINQKANLPEQSLIMIPTGGSSGKVRFTMHTWLTLRASVVGFQAYFNCKQINSFCTLPLYHVSGLMQFLRSFLTRGNLIICPYKVVKTKQVNFNQQDCFISLVPTQLQFLIEHSPNWLAQFKTVLLGGAPTSRSLLNLAREYQIPLAPTYGMTETASQIVTLKPQDFLAGNNSSGQVLPHAQITIEPEPNQTKNFNIGLINISCNSLCLGYYPQFFPKSKILVTDDLGYFDAQGYLYLLGRKSQKIITGGKNVFPTEVEAAIFSTKLVKDVCVIGKPDFKWGQAITAIYVPLNLGHNLDLIKLKIASQIAKYKQPKYWIEVDRLPRNNRGKVNYQKLQVMAEKIISNE